MLRDESERRQEQLEKYLYELADKCLDESQIKEKAEQLKGLYTDGFRHHYSKFFPLIDNIAKNENNEENNLDYLSNNLQEISKFIEDDSFNGNKTLKSLYLPLLKLTDHLNLEIARFISYTSSESKIKDLEVQHQKTILELKTARSELEEAKKRLSSIQTEIIAVLSIFAAIVLTFSGSMSLIGNALSNMENAPFFKSAFFISLCGFIVLNLIFLMMYIVGKITGRNIYAHCQTENCTCGKNNLPVCNGLNRVRKRLPYIFWTNFVLIIIITIGLFLSLKPELLSIFYYIKNLF